MNIIAYTEKGLSKKENEDRLLVGSQIIANGLHQIEYFGGPIVICDGVGGNNAGATASEFVVRKIADAGTLSIELLTSINSNLLQESNSNGCLHGMATTLTAILPENNSLKIFHVGNTRLYALTARGYLNQLTHDDTTVQFLLDTSQMNETEAVSFDKRNEITACMGGGNSNLFKLKSDETPMTSNIYVLTCDGIHDYLDIDTMESIFSDCGGDYKFAISKLCGKARESRSVDDITIAIITP